MVEPSPLFVIDKPHGITSMDVVRILRRILKVYGIQKIGYAGTLDPYATGVLVIGIGSGTKMLGELTDQDKEYICEIDFLKDSESGDMQSFKSEYQKSLPKDFKIPSISDIDKLITEKFIGTVTQIPPNLSAIKIGGQKACDMARKGIMLEMKPRDIQIYENEIMSYEFPILKLRVKCSKGTYIRTLGQDIGRALGLWGTLLSLRRTRSGEYMLSDALSLDTLRPCDLGFV